MRLLMNDTFTFKDAIIVLIYLIAVLSMAFYYSRGKSSSTKDYFLAGKNMGWVAIGLSIFATNISSEHFIGLAGSGSVSGLAVGQFELMAIFILIFLAWFLTPIFFKSGVYTVPELLEKRFDKTIAQWYSGFSIFIYITTKILVTLYAGGMLFYEMFHLNLYTSAVIIVFITGLYSIIGGSGAIIRTQVLQSVLLLIGAILLTIFGLDRVGWFTGLSEALPSDYFSLFRPMSDPDFPWTGILFGAPILAFWYWCADQYIVQKIFSAKSIEHARKGTLLAAVLKITPIFILVLPGLIAAVLYPEVKGDKAYPTLLASDLLPVGIKGIVVVGLLSAIMSSLASTFNTAATLFTFDFYKKRYPKESEEKLVLIGRLSTTAIVLVAILIIPIVKLFNTQIYLFIQSFQACVSPPITAVFLWGLIFKFVNTRAAMVSLIFGELIGLFRLTLDGLVNSGIISGTFWVMIANVNFLHFSIFLFVLTSILILSISLATTKENQIVPDNWYVLAADAMNGTKINLGIKERFINSIFITIFLFAVIIVVWGLWT
jgi:SSS family solute:Na+ symporter